MANGTSAQPALAQPDLGGMSPEDYLQQRERADGIAVGGADEVQAPPPQPGMPTTLGEFGTRYLKAAGEGAAFNAPFAGAEALWGPPGWAASAGTLGLGALGGVEGQATEDIYRGITGKEAPWWLPPTVATIGTMGAGGAQQWTRAAALRAGRAIASHPGVAGGGLIGGGLAVHGLADTILANASHLIGNVEQWGPAAAAIGLGAGFVKSARNVLRSTPNFQNLKVPIASAVGGAAPETVNALSPSPSDYSTP